MPDEYPIQDGTMPPLFRLIEVFGTPVDSSEPPKWRLAVLSREYNFHSERSEIRLREGVKRSWWRKRRDLYASRWRWAEPAGSE